MYGIKSNKLVWIVETTYKARKISFDDLNRKWMDNIDLSGGEDMLNKLTDQTKARIFSWV